MTLDETFMHLALRLAAKGRGKTSPNPMVGAVVVRGSRIVGRGYHHKAGEPHAEVLALRQAGNRARGATLYLNLEPCSHFGRTPPCTDTILQAGIRRVVTGMKDPNPLVAGKGIRRLRRAGVEVEVGILESECREMNAPFCKYITMGSPFVILKAACSLDGKTATHSGDSHWVSSEASRKRVHRLRMDVDAVMVGSGTVRRDDPLLTVRLPGAKVSRQPLRVVVDSRLGISLSCQLVRTAGRYRTLVATTQKASPAKIRKLQKAKVEVWMGQSDARGRVRLSALAEELGRRGIVSVLLEGGATLNASAIRERIVDRILVFFAPKIVGGQKAPGFLGGKGVSRMRDAEPIKILKTGRVGPDIVVEGSLVSRRSSPGRPG
jgi:diaminohydroxyphosphoribosylaminopyrimidine deaminase/5-amino-6-(5-phosphoribosylamino)uracil reductase